MAGMQTAQEQRTLHAEWLRHAKVEAFATFIRGHAQRSDKTGLEAINEAMAVARQWITDNGDLPDSGITEF